MSVVNYDSEPAHRPALPNYASARDSASLAWKKPSHEETCGTILVVSLSIGLENNDFGNPILPELRMPVVK